MREKIVVVGSSSSEGVKKLGVVVVVVVVAVVRVRVGVVLSAGGQRVGGRLDHVSKAERTKRCFSL